MKKKLVHIYTFLAVLSVVANFQHPVTPIYLLDIGLAYELYGFLFAFMALGLAVFAPIAGLMVDKHGTKYLLPIGLTGYAISQALFGTFSNIVPLVIVRFLAGVSVSMVFPIIISFVVKISTKEYRVRALSTQFAISMLFVSIGYYLGGWLNNYVPAKTFFYIQAVCLLVLAFWALVFLPNVKAHMENKMRFSFKQLPKGTSILLILFFIMHMVTQMITRFLDVYIISNGYTAQELGLFVMISGFVGMFANFVVLPYLSRILKEEAILLIILSLGGASLYASFNVFGSLWMGLYTFFMIYVLMKSMYDPLHNSIISHYSDDHQGRIIGLSESSKMMGMFIGPILGGIIYAKDPILLFSIASGILLFGVVLWRFISGKTISS